MRTVTLGLIAMAMMMPAQARSQNAQEARLIGRWSGDGIFLNDELNHRVGSIPFKIEFTANRSGSGTAGDATLSEVSVKPTRDGFEVRAKLSQPVGPDPALKKDKLVLMLTFLSDSTIKTEFHLKSNFTFDLSMREGSMLLKRVH